MANRGGLLIGGIFVAALCATGASLWYRYHETHQALELWGPKATQCIADPERVEALTLAPAGTGPADFTVDGQALTIVGRRDVTTAPGFTNARHALTLNRSFDWTPIAPVPSNAPAGQRPTWTHALRFDRPQQTATLLISFDAKQAMMVGNDRRIRIGPIAKGLENLLIEPPRTSSEGR
ncbi:MAG: hypothetical protein K8T25_01705 [Planctomycetia bacterium]|nr:hypothetical protein [Planctomycetia bacterium]